MIGIGGKECVGRVLVDRGSGRYDHGGKIGSVDDGGDGNIRVETRLGQRNGHRGRGDRNSSDTYLCIHTYDRGINDGSVRSQ